MFYFGGRGIEVKSSQWVDSICQLRYENLYLRQADKGVSFASKPSTKQYWGSLDDFMKELQHNKSKATHMQIKKKLALTAPSGEGAHCANPVGFLTALF